MAPLWFVRKADAIHCRRFPKVQAMPVKPSPESVIEKIRRWVGELWGSIMHDYTMDNVNVSNPEDKCALCNRSIYDHEDQCPVAIFIEMHKRYPLAGSVELARAALDEAAIERSRCRQCSVPFNEGEARNDGMHITCADIHKKEQSNDPQVHIGPSRRPDRGTRT